jgi:hypothetical protein
MTLDARNEPRMAFDAEGTQSPRSALEAEKARLVQAALEARNARFIQANLEKLRSRQDAWWSTDQGALPAPIVERLKRPTLLDDPLRMKLPEL